MKRRPTLAIVPCLLATTVFVGGCKDMPSSAAIRREIETELPGARFERESHIHLGRFAMTFARPIARWSMDKDDEARIIISSIKRVDISTYRVISLPDKLDDATLRRIESRMSDHGWTQIVRERDRGNNTWIFSRHDESGSIRGIVVVELDGDELSIVGVEGRLDEVLIDAITDDSDGFSSLFGT